jgi:MinD-like ATPase involved in chromosome partitioning or flagellar assembly
MSRGPVTTPVLVAAAGASWEAQALERLERAGNGIVLARRCVDLTDLLATAGAGLASVAVVSPALPGLDADSVSVLRRAGVGVVLVAAPEELLDGDVERLRRLGIAHLLASTDLAGLPAAVLGANAGAAPAEPGPDDDLGGVGGQEDEGAAGSAPGKVVAVWGPTGAPGRTTVAVGIATEAARRDREVLLVDVDAYGGAVAQHLGVLDEVSGLLAATRTANAGQLDGVRLGALARRVGDRLRVVTGLPRPDRWQEVRPTAFRDLLDQAAGLASLVVLDVGFSLESDPLDPFGSSAPQRNEMTLASLQRADEVVVVGAADPVGLARLARGLVELHDVLPRMRPRVVVNRTRASLGWSDREIRGMVEGFVQPVDVHFLPDDRAAADRALMAGHSLAESGESPLREAMSDLARGVLGDLVPRTPHRRRVRRRRAGKAR